METKERHSRLGLSINNFGEKNKEGRQRNLIIVLKVMMIPWARILVIEIDNRRVKIIFKR